MPSSIEPEEKRNEAVDYTRASEPKKEETDKVVAKAKSSKESKKSFFREFFVTDLKDIGQHILYNIVVPALKETAYNMSEGAVNMLLFGGERKHRSSSRYGREKTSYDRFYDDRRDSASRHVRERSSVRLIDEVTFESREDAVRVLDRLIDDLERYDFVTVADLCTYSDIPTDRNYTLRNWGWTDLRDADIRQIRGGEWLLSLPRPEQIDRRR